MLSTLTWHANYKFTINTEGGESKKISKIRSKIFWKNIFWKTSLHFLVEDAKPFHLI